MFRSKIQSLALIMGVKYICIYVYAQTEDWSVQTSFWNTIFVFMNQFTLDSLQPIQSIFALV